MMRKVLLLILVLIGGYSYGQVYQQMSQYGVEFKRMDNDSVLRIPRGLGSLRSISGYDTAQIRYNVSDSSVYVHTGNGWIKVVRGADADSSVFATIHKLYTTIDSLGNLIISENLGNTNLTQSDAIRTYDGDGGELSFSNLGKFKVNASDSAIIKSSNIYGTATNSFVIDSIGGMQLRKYGPDAVVTINLDENSAIINSENIDDTSTLIVTHNGISMTSSNYISLTADSILITNTPSTLTTDYDVLVRDENTGKVGIATISDGGADSTIFSTNYRRDTAIANVRSQLPLAANPTASVGLSAVNGSATTFMRSDAAPALDQSIAPTWTGIHTFNGNTNFSGTITASNLLSGASTDSIVTVSTPGVFNKRSIASVVNSWGLLGTAGTNATTNFLGTSDATSMVIKVNNGNGSYPGGGSTITDGSNHAILVQTPTNNGSLVTINPNGKNLGNSAVLTVNWAGGQTTFSNGGVSISSNLSVGSILTTGLIQNNSATNFRLSSGTVLTRFDYTNQSVLIGTQTNVPSSILTLDNTSKGFLPPRMTTTQRNAISSPASGLLVHNTDSTKLSIYDNGRWNQIPKVLINTSTLDFGSTSAQSSADLTITVTGADDGDMVSLGVANAATLTNSSYTAWVSAADTVTVRFNNYSSGSQDPASATFKVQVFK